MVEFSVELDGKEYNVQGKIVKGEKRTRHYPGTPSYVEVDYETLYEEMGRDLTEEEVIKVEDIAQEQFEYIPDKEDLMVDPY